MTAGGFIKREHLQTHGHPLADVKSEPGLHEYPRRKPVYRCEVVGCAFEAQFASHMHRHGLTHNDNRPYKCGWPGCDYASKQREHLQTHQLKHSDARPFQCGVPGCAFVTKRREHLVRHLKRHHDMRCSNLAINLAQPLPAAPDHQPYHQPAVQPSL